MTSCNNEALPLNNYIAGFEGGQQFRNWFEFPITALNGGSLTSSTLNIYEPSSSEGFSVEDGHSGGTQTYAVYGNLPAGPFY